MIVYHAYHKEKPVFYIGKTMKTLIHRRRQHENEAKYERTNSVFHKAIRKYGEDMFEWGILEMCDTLDELNASEIKWIALVKECGHRLYNLTTGGDGNNGGRYWADNEIPQEMRDKISNGLKDYYRHNTHSQKGKTRKGHSHTEETKAKMSVSKMGHGVSEETRMKLRIANEGKSLQPHVIAILKEKFSGKNNPSAKPIICLTTDEIFDYAKLAAIKYNIDLSSIIKCCRGKAKTCNKMEFAYITGSPTGYPAGWKKL